MVAQLGGGPNGAAIGPDGKCYICNNGGFKWTDDETGLRPILQADDYSGGRIERVDLATGAVETLYTASDQGLRMRFLSPAGPCRMMTRPRDCGGAGHVDREAGTVFCCG